MSEARPLRVLLLGATGALGRRAAAELALSPSVATLDLAARDRDALDELHAALGGPGGKARPAPPGVEQTAAFSSVDVAVSCAGPAAESEPALVAAARAARTPYVSLCDDVETTVSLRASATDDGATGPTIVLGCGLRPGLTNVLVKLAADRLEAVDSVSIAVAGSMSSDHGPASELHVLQCLDAAATVVAGGRRETDTARSSPKLVYFPEPVGWVETFRCSHPEVATLHDAYPGIDSLQWRYGLAERAAMDAVRASVAMGATGTAARRRRWLAATAPLRPLVGAIAPRRGGWSAARVDVWGRAGGRTRELSLGVVDHLANLVTLPLAHVAIELGRRAIDKPGIWAPEEVVDAGALLRSLSARGLRVARLEPSPI